MVKKGAAPTMHTLAPASESPSAVLFGSGEPSSEYFLVENRQKSGFDAALPGSGLLVWHIDDAMDGNSRQCMPVPPGACALRHYKVAVVQADGKWDLERGENSGDAGDPFPGDKGVTSFTDDTVPAARLYSGARTGIRITSIAQSGRNVTALMSYGAPTRSFLLSLMSTGSGRGQVSFDPAGSFEKCTGSCFNQFAGGTTVNLVAKANDGSAFTGWSGAG